MLNRENDLPAIEWSDGRKEWWINGERHRERDLPAIDYDNNRRQWWKKGMLNREGGLPAIEYYNIKEWWINGVSLSETKAKLYIEFCSKMKEKIKNRAQKKIYFWWIPICYDIMRTCGQRMAQKNLNKFEQMITTNKLFL